MSVTSLKRELPQSNASTNESEKKNPVLSKPQQIQAKTTTEVADLIIFPDPPLNTKQNTDKDKKTDISASQQTRVTIEQTHANEQVAKVATVVSSQERFNSLITQPVENTTKKIADLPPPIVDDEKPIDIKHMVIQPIMRACKELIQETIKANCGASSAELNEQLASVNKAFEEGEALFMAFLDSPKFYVTELLRFFGSEKKPLSFALRRMIAAYNSGDSTRIKEIADEYKAIASSHDFKEIATALNTQDANTLMINLPNILKNRFSLANVELQELGVKILKRLFDKTRTHLKVVSALEQLRKKANSSDLPNEMEKFLKLVHEEAKITPDQYLAWNEDLTRCRFQTTFKKTVCNMLLMIEQNIRILELIFDKNKPKADPFVELDQTFLLSESEDCIKDNRREMQQDLYKLQSVFNDSRSADEKYMLIALNEKDQRTYKELIDQEETFKLCFEARKENIQELEKINTSKKIQELNKKHNVRIVAVPVTLNDHPLKTYKEHGEIIKLGAWLLQSWLPMIVKPKLMQALPQMEETHIERFDKFFTMLSKLPIYPLFERVIIMKKGEALAAIIETAHKNLGKSIHI